MGKIAIRRRGRAVIAAAFAFSLSIAFSTTPVVTGSADGQTFRDTALPGTGGSEPSLAIDTGGTASKNYMYVTRIGGSPALWHSYDLGNTWSAQVPYHALAQACQRSVFGDEDVTVLPNGNVLVAHLNVSNIDVQVSTDHGQTFGNCASVGAEADRQWFGNNGNNLVYLAYHDFAAEDPLVCGSIDGGVTFLTCVNTFGGSAATAQCAENTIMARPVVIDPTDGSINIPYSCSTAAENAAHPPYGPLHDYKLARSMAPLVNGQAAAYTTSPIFTADTTGKTPNYANIFSALRIDSAGNYYFLFSGTADDAHVLSNPYHVYLTVSKNKGATWSTPRMIDAEADGKGTHVFADMVVGSAGQVDIVWLSAYDPTTGVDVTGEPNGICGSTGMVSTCTDNGQNVGMYPGGPVKATWKLFMAQSTNALAALPQYTITPVTFTGPTPVVPASSVVSVHNGEICTNGIVCSPPVPGTGQPSSDRSLSDYITVALDCSGNAHTAYYANGLSDGTSNGTGVNHVADQTGGTTLQPPATCPAAVIVPEVKAVTLLPLGGAALILLALVLRTRRERRRLA